MKKKMLLSLVLIVLVSLMLCRVQAAEGDGATTPTITDTPEASTTPDPEPSTTPDPEPSTTPDPEPTATPDPEPTPEPTEEWTDFSNAEIQLTKDGVSHAYVQVKNVTLKEDHSYYVKIGSSKDINITQESADTILSNTNDTGVYRTAGSIDKYVEFNQDIYVSILETYVENGETKNKTVVDGKKLERFAEPKYSDAFFATFMSNSGTQIVTNFVHAEENERKMEIKVGRITDVEILKKIKNKNSSGFADLLSYAKTNPGIFDRNVDCAKDDFQLCYSYSQEKINLTGLIDEQYYFLYVKPDDENGKYFGREAVTLARASVYPDQDNSWYLFFYGSDDFKWAEFGEGAGKDDTIAPDKVIPQTGAKDLIGLSILSVICVGGVLTYAGYRKNNYK